MRELRAAIIFTMLLWGINALWMMRDSRPPVWDMALHQSYALNYTPDHESARPMPLRDYSGNYPPFVHLVIALFFTLLHPGTHTAILSNIPATLILMWAVFRLARDLGSPGAARWTCFLLAVTPYMMWMSRETILDYWLAAWVAAGLVLLLESRGFELRSVSILLGVVIALGMLTKWLFAGFLAIPFLYVCIECRIWKYPERLVNLADTVLIAGIVAGTWYLPNLPKLIRYFSENARIGEREGEPPVLSFQSLIYYLRLLEGYQLLGILFLILCISSWAVYKRRLLRGGVFLFVAVAGGWLAVTLLRTKDPRFTLPLLGPLLVVPGVWMDSWSRHWLGIAARTMLAVVLCIQAYAINFGIRWLPQEITLAKGYEGSLRWDWNLFLQHYFHILGPPRLEDWKQAEILRSVMAHSGESGMPATLALVPDLPRFNAANFHLQARLEKMPLRVDHPQSAADGIRSFDGFNYVIMTEKDQGMPWTTLSSRALNQIIVDEPEVFRLLGVWTLPNGDGARLYFIRRNAKEDS
jgi:4-amino-4-deoxy-L-arabinose transferase-like glycosyltransferase